MKRFITLALAACAFAAQAAPAHPDSTAKQEELKAVHGQLEKLKKDLAANENHKSEAADALKESEQAISDANRTLASLDDEREATAEELSELESGIAHTRSSIQKSQDRLTLLLRARYKAGEIEAWRLLLNQQDPNTVTRDLAYYRYLADAQQTLARKLQSQLNKLNELAEKVRSKQAALERIAAEKKKQRQTLQSQRKQKKELLSKLDQEIGSQRKQIQKLAADEKRLGSLIEKLDTLARRQEAERQKQAARKKVEPTRVASNKTVAPPTKINEQLPDESQAAAAFAALKGKLRLPARGEIVGRFGAARSEGSNWKGLFIRAPEGQSIKSIANGHVIYADWLRGFGNILIVDHGGGYISVYGACESLLKQVGDTLKAGDTIATTGNSGGMGDSGVYFEIRQNGRPLDPQSWTN